ncbi:hypothetical protein JKF63_02137 [Porcisia hertigi]|uniref:Guanine nucleotide-binding protein subunit beta-like protein n=1 Tax=Porcisia hertigi TaxID=2761500 RepID=A0A836HP08_9TRYP|nr:hypothetical protein JKF63_02137 [Porcisia hertigi]
MPSQQLHSVASELLLNDRTLVVPAPPLSIATAGDMVWIAFSDGKVEVRNTRTGEVARRFEPAVSAVATSAPVDSGAVGILSNMTNQMPVRSTLGVGGATRMSAPLKQGGDQNAMAALTTNGAVIVRVILAVPTVDGGTHVWMGLSNGCIEVHDGEAFSSSSLETAVGVSNRPSACGLVALMRKHEAAVTSLTEFGGFVYSGSEDCQILQWRACHPANVRPFSSRCLHNGPVRCLYAEGNALVSGSDDCTVKVWDIGEGTMRLTGYFHSQSGGVLALCRVGEHMWSGDASGQVVRWLLRTCEAVGIHTPHSGRIMSLCRVGNRVYSGSSDGAMGIFDAATGQLLQHIMDQALGWVTAVECPAQLSRFVVWSSSTDGAVRCWYQDEYVNMSADETRFSDSSWYISGSTPYREFRAAVRQRTQQLKQQLEAIEHRDNQAMALLRRCSAALGGGGSELEIQQQQLHGKLAKAEERCRTAEKSAAAKRDAIAQMDRDITTTLALLQNARSELNSLLPGEAEKVLASMPTVSAEALVAYTPTPGLAILDTTMAAPHITKTSQSESAAAPPQLSSSLIPPPSVPTVTVNRSTAEASAYPRQQHLLPSTHATSITPPVGPPALLGPLRLPFTPVVPPPNATVPITNLPPPPAAATTSTLGVGGSLTASRPFLPPSSALTTGASASAPAAGTVSIDSTAAAVTAGPGVGIAPAAGAGLGTAAGAGLGTAAGAGLGTAAGAGLGTAAGAGLGTTAGPGVVIAPAVGAGPGTTAGAGLGVGLGTTAGPGVAIAPAVGAGLGTTAGPGVGIAPAAGAGPGTAAGAGLGTTAGPGVAIAPAVGAGPGTAAGAGVANALAGGAGPGTANAALEGSTQARNGTTVVAVEKNSVLFSPGHDSFNWTNPHVGNYIQRRYYGASPSLRTTDLMKQERRRGRLPRVKVEALQRNRSHSRSSPAPRETKPCPSGACSKQETSTMMTTVLKASST